MQSGSLRAKIRVQHEVATGSGSFAKKSWYDLDDSTHTGSAYNIPAQWVNVHGTEAWIADSVQAQLGATVTIRYRSDIMPSCRILLGSMVYQIVSLDNIRQRNEWLEIKVKATVMG